MNKYDEMTYTTGYESYERGLSINSNPYFIDSKEFSLWNEGWIAAQDEAYLDQEGYLAGFHD